MSTKEIRGFMTGIQHIGLPTRKYEQSIGFYKKLGFSCIYETKNADKRVGFLQLESLVIELYEDDMPAGQSGAWDHVAIDVQDIETLYDLIKEADFHIVSDGIESLAFWEKGIKYFIIEGLNREKIEFCQRL